MQRVSFQFSFSYCAKVETAAGKRWLQGEKWRIRDDGRSRGFWTPELREWSKSQGFSPYGNELCSFRQVVRVNLQRNLHQAQFLPQKLHKKAATRAPAEGLFLLYFSHTK